MVEVELHGPARGGGAAMETLIPTEADREVAECQRPSVALL